MEIPGIFRAMMWKADTMMQVQMPKFAKISSDFICIYNMIAGGWGSALDLSNCCFVFIFKHRTTARWNMLLGSWKVLE